MKTIVHELTIENNASFKCCFTATSGTSARLSGGRDLLDGPILLVKVVAKENGLWLCFFGVANLEGGPKPVLFGHA